MRLLNLLKHLISGEIINFNEERGIDINLSLINIINSINEDTKKKVKHYYDYAELITDYVMNAIVYTFFI